MEFPEYDPDPVPDHELNAYPVLGLAVTCTEEPELYHAEDDDRVPPPEVATCSVR